jgi:hypothetical protein
LALEFSVPDLNAVIDVLRCFLCLEKLYVIVSNHLCFQCEVYFLSSSKRDYFFDV